MYLTHPVVLSARQLAERALADEKGHYEHQPQVVT